MTSLGGPNVVNKVHENKTSSVPQTEDSQRVSLYPSRPVLRDSLPQGGLSQEHTGDEMAATFLKGFRV